MTYNCPGCNTSISTTAEVPIYPCASCGYTPEKLSKEDIIYLMDFITQILREQDEDDPYPDGEGEYLLEIKHKLRNMLTHN
jgi:hypothetical protein